MRLRHLPILAVLAVAVVAGACRAEPHSVDRVGSSRDPQHVFSASCASCHGADLSGTPDGPAMLGDPWLAPARPDSTYAAVIERRIGWDDSVDVDALIAYIRSLQ